VNSYALYRNYLHLNSTSVT